MTRSTRAVIDLSALRHNLQRAREAAPHSRILAVVKADAYGHGMARVATALADADGFGVARVEEAERLRAAGITRPVLLLSGVSDAEELDTAARFDLDVVIHHHSQVTLLEQARLERTVRAWLKVDTGMHRLGFDPHDAPGVRQRLEACAAVAKPIRLMTHLARADERGDPSTVEQIGRIRALATDAGVEVSIANSAGVLGWPDSHADWVRPGIMLYGISPFVGGRAAREGLRPVMTFSSRLIAVNRVRRGEAIGYGGTWTAPEDMPVGVVAVGYGDGYPRHAPSGTPVIVNDTRVALIGRVSMDMLSVDLRALPSAKPGDPVILWGRGLAVEEVAEHVGSIGYELVTRIAPRVAIEFVDTET